MVQCLPKSRSKAITPSGAIEALCQCMVGRQKPKEVFLDVVHETKAAVGPDRALTTELR